MTDDRKMTENELAMQRDLDALRSQVATLSAELDEAKNRAAEVAPLREYLAREQERKFAAEAQLSALRGVVEAAREARTACDLAPGPVDKRRWCLAHQEWTPCSMAELTAALARLDTDTPDQPNYAEECQVERTCHNPRLPSQPWCADHAPTPDQGTEGEG